MPGAYERRRLTIEDFIEFSRWRVRNKTSSNSCLLFIGQSFTHDASLDRNGRRKKEKQISEKQITRLVLLARGQVEFVHDVLVGLSQLDQNHAESDADV